VKFFSSLKWQSKFEEAAKIFEEHTKGIQLDLQIHMTLNITEVRKDISLMMQVAFESLKSAISKK
jgi:hypothetical protein